MTQRINTLIITFLFVMGMVLSTCKTTENVPFIPGPGQTGRAGSGITVPPPGSGGRTGGTGGSGGTTQKACATVDTDSDGYSICTGTNCQCTIPAGTIDCVDSNPKIHPYGTEVCNNGFDDNCDNVIDSGDNNVCQNGDTDGDGDVDEDDGNGNGGKGKAKKGWSTLGKVALGTVITVGVTGAIVGAVAYEKMDDYTLEHCQSWYNEFKGEYLNKRIGIVNDLKFNEAKNKDLKRWYWWDPDVGNMCKLIDKVAQCESDNDNDGEYRSGNQFVAYVLGQEKISNINTSTYRRVGYANCSGYTKDALAKTGECYNRYGWYLGNASSIAVEKCPTLLELISCTEKEASDVFLPGYTSDQLYGKGKTLDTFISDVLGEENYSKKSAEIKDINQASFIAKYDELKCDEATETKLTKKIAKQKDIKELAKIVNAPVIYISKEGKRDSIKQSARDRIKELEKEASDDAKAERIRLEGEAEETRRLSEQEKQTKVRQLTVLKEKITQARTVEALQPLLVQLEGFNEKEFPLVGTIRTILQTKPSYLALEPDQIQLQYETFSIHTCFDDPTPCTETTTKNKDLWIFLENACFRNLDDTSKEHVFAKCLSGDMKFEEIKVSHKDVLKVILKKALENERLKPFKKK